MKKAIVLPILTGLILGIIAACATTGGADYAEQAARGVDVFAGKTWNAPVHNNMYDRWEFNTDGTFHFWHVHHSEPLDRGVYRYELNDGIITIAKEGEDVHSHYRYVFGGNTVVLTPFLQNMVPQNTGSGTSHQMGALPETAVVFTEAK
ncbi:MAG: hypothetical protein LBG27_03260 [Spirochaetaceae bacterium]|jgi:hypothetical protein|nr:hypothetical protein [Spirochaetaceae bacterium]